MFVSFCTAVVTVIVAVVLAVVSCRCLYILLSFSALVTVIVAVVVVVDVVVPVVVMRPEGTPSCRTPLPSCRAPFPISPPTPVCPAHCRPAARVFPFPLRHPSARRTAVMPRAFSHFPSGTRLPGALPSCRAPFSISPPTPVCPAHLPPWPLLSCPIRTFAIGSSSRHDTSKTSRLARSKQLTALPRP
eukprot:365358-Chlamydomonas_euryale.AAC.4